MSVSQIFYDQMSVGQIFFDQMSIGKIMENVRYVVVPNVTKRIL